MDKIKGLCLLIVTALCILAYSPAFAEETDEGNTEVFINSNALNSTVTIVSDGEAVSGPGNKVLANLEDGSSFDVELAPAEGSEVMAFTMKINDLETGEVRDLEPVSQDGNTYSYEVPAEGSGRYRITGETYFGDPAEESEEEAKTSAESSAMDKITADQAQEGAEVSEAPEASQESDASESADGAENAEAFAAADDTQSEDEGAVADDEAAAVPEEDTQNAAAAVSEAGENPKTGAADTDAAVALSLLGLLGAGVVLLKSRRA
ncbi:MAG: LPXTG cell wall anchor domain-containing protein [Eubacterium sp.]|nr:LPXTG cell wall anchor domain-containing protein [Eubacterium sp.]